MSDVRVALAHHGERYLSRVYSSTEIADSSVGGQLDPSSLAARFAAKEAMLKVASEEGRR